MNNIEELIVASIKIVLRNEVGYSEDRIKTALNWNWAEIKDEIEKYQSSKQTGHWITGRSIYYDVEMYRCSECKNWCPYKVEKCPSCHIKMIGDK